MRGYTCSAIAKELQKTWSSLLIYFRVKIALNHIQIIFLRSKTSLPCFSLFIGGGKIRDKSRYQAQQKGRKNNTFFKTYPDIFYVLKPP
jgi:hypothetical protein